MPRDLNNRVRSRMALAAACVVAATVGLPAVAAAQTPPPQPNIVGVELDIDALLDGIIDGLLLLLGAA